MARETGDGRLTMVASDFIPLTLWPHGLKSGKLESVVSNAGEGLQRVDQGRNAFTYFLNAWDELGRIAFLSIRTVRQWRTRFRACVKTKSRKADTLNINKIRNNCSCC